jgi:parvulin-like peptidyl-prolyl isomerase
MPRRGFVFILFLIMFLPACGNQDRLPSQILLRVDGRTVSLERFQRDFEQILPGDRTLPKEEEQALRRSYLAQRIDHELLLAEAAKLHLNVSLQTVQQAMDSHRESYPPGEFDRMLVDKGLTTEDWQRMLNEELLVEKVFDRVVRDKATVSEADIEAYFAAHRQSFIRPERVRARQITVNDESEGRRILERLRQGMPFQEAARRFSISPDAEQGGELGIFARGEMPEAFDLAVFDLPAGRISELIKSEYGYHIFLVEEHLPALKPDLKTVREEIIAILRRRKEEIVYHNWLQKLRQEASIEVDWTLF